MTLRPADRALRSQANLQNPRRNAVTPTSIFHKLTFANQGNQGRAQDTAKITTRRKSSEWSAFWKNLLRRYCSVRRLPDNFLLLVLSAELVLWSWRRDSNPRPSDYKSDALPTELRQQLGKGASPRKLIPRIPSRCPGQLSKVSQGKQGVQPRFLPLPSGNL